jgi:hypothetical protein
MASDWNLWLDRQIAADLTETERRLAEVLARLTLGWNLNPNEIGEKLLREIARLDGRTLGRARAALVEKGLLRYTAGSVGRGHRSVYELLLTEKPALQRAITTPEKPAQERAIGETVKARSGGRKKPAPQRVRRERRGKDSPASPAEIDPDLMRRAFDTYTGAGGNTLLSRERGALARNVASLVKAGVDEPTILAACRDLGRNGEFPGLLKQRAQAISAGGGPCTWEQNDRAQLTLAQLAECGCPRCAEWLGYRQNEQATGVRA